MSTEGSTKAILAALAANLGIAVTKFIAYALTGYARAFVDTDPALAMDSLVVGDSPLTERETEVLRACADGAAVATVAQRVHLSPGTVRNHLSAAIGKTGAVNRAEAVQIATSRGWL